MDIFIKEKFTEVSNHIISKCQKSILWPEDFFNFYNYFLYLKTTDYDVNYLVLLAKSLVEARICFEIDPKKTEKEVLNDKKSMGSYL